MFVTAVLSHTCTCAQSDYTVVSFSHCAADKGPWTLLRGYWFEVVGEKWYPLVVAEYDVIEIEHCQKKWREKVSK